ncbi:MAG: carbon-nitrogen hydrolase family protein [Candidatus Sericytochromatia bacterium]|nr:carbon-nitrogen hydrolase family protein [Candidatus Sericytochromatia bacterium]
MLAAIQLNSQADPAANLSEAVRWIQAAAAAGADVVALPETFLYIGPSGQTAQHIQALDGPVMQELRHLSQTLGIYLLAGSIHEAVPDSDKLYNTACWLGPDGQRLSVYRKIHLFDIDAPSVRLKESDTFLAGDTDQQPLLQTPLGCFGTSICYDLRFPEFYRRLALGGAEVIFVPAAFTHPTGQAHWELLLRARAIENQVYIVAPNQCGRHPGGRHSYGHSLIIDPWGDILAQAGTEPGFILAAFSAERLQQVRRQLPCLQHQRLL